jgi:hypothetical protein
MVETRYFFASNGFEEIEAIDYHNNEYKMLNEHSSRLLDNLYIYYKMTIL